MKYLKSVTILLLGLIIFSCSSGDDIDNPTPNDKINNPPENNDDPIQNLTPITFELTWQQSLNSQLYQSTSLHNFIKTSDGGYIGSGSIYINKDDSDLNVIKYDSNLNVQWEKIYSGNKREVGGNIIETSDGNFIIASTTNSTDGTIKNSYGEEDALLLKLNPAGDLLWQKTYGGSKYDIGGGLIKTANGDLIMYGRSLSDDFDLKENNGARGLWMTNLNEKGEVNWSRTYEFDPEIRINQIIEHQDGYVLGGGNNSTHEMAVSMINSIGEIQWTTNLGKLNYGKTIIDKNGGYISLIGNGDFYSNLEVIKMNDNGVIQWRSSIEGSRQELPGDIIQTEDSSIIVLGASPSNDGDIGANYGDRDVIVAKLNGSGDLLGINNFGSTEREWANTIFEIGKGEYLINSMTVSFGNNDVIREASPTRTDNHWLFKVKEVEK